MGEVVVGMFSKFLQTIHRRLQHSLVKAILCHSKGLTSRLKEYFLLSVPWNGVFLGQRFSTALFSVKNTHSPQISRKLVVKGERLSIQNYSAGDCGVDLGVEKSLKLTTRHYILLTKEHSNPTCLL